MNTITTAKAQELATARRNAMASHDHDAYRAVTAEMDALGVTGADLVRIERDARWAAIRGAA